MIATIMQDFCGANGCGAGETIIAVVLIIAITCAFIAMLRM